MIDLAARRLCFRRRSSRSAASYVSPRAARRACRRRVVAVFLDSASGPFVAGRGCGCENLAFFCRRPWLLLVFLCYRGAPRRRAGLLPGAPGAARRCGWADVDAAAVVIDCESALDGLCSYHEAKQRQSMRGRRELAACKALAIGSLTSTRLYSRIRALWPTRSSALCLHRHTAALW